MVDIVELGPHAPEASSILPIADQELLTKHDYDRGFWVCLDEFSAGKALAIVGHRRASAPLRRWEVKRIPAKEPSGAPRTQDSEALVRDDQGWIYLLGSQFGPKSGPLDVTRAFVARFQESASATDEDDAVVMQLRRRPFLLHRKINDALVAADVELLPLGPNMRERYIAKTMRKGAKKDKAWHVDLRVEDWPINIEGAHYMGEDTFLVGLRYPTSAAGEPLLIRVQGLRRWFEAPPVDEPEAELHVEFAGRISGISDRSCPVGIRGMTEHQGNLHVLVGAIGTARKPTAIDIDYPESTRLDCSHVMAPNPGREGIWQLEGETLYHFDGHPNVEGLAHDGKGGWVYVLDEDHMLRILVAAEAE